MKRVGEKVLSENPMMTKGDLIELCGLPRNGYDTALPQNWLWGAADRLYRHCDFEGDALSAYDRLRAQTVWLYEAGSLFGQPYFMVKELADLMEGIEHEQRR